MNIPNLITIFRMALIPVFLYVFNSSNLDRILYSGIIFVIAGISDVLDGYIARKYNMQSKLGTVLDPLADKLMSFTVLISFTIDGLIPIWILIPMIIKEIVMIVGGINLYFMKEKSVIPSNKFGKVATFSLYAAIVSIVVKFSSYISLLLLFVTVTLNLIAFFSYFKIFMAIKKAENNTVDKSL